MLTVFSILRDFNFSSNSANDHLETVLHTEWMEVLHTHNAIGSWLRLPEVSVILFGVESSCRLVMSLVENSPQMPLCLPIPCFDEIYHVPRYDCLFSKAAEVANSEFLM